MSLAWRCSPAPQKASRHGRRMPSTLCSWLSRPNRNRAKGSALTTSHRTIKRLPSILDGIEIRLLCDALCDLLVTDLLDAALNPPDIAQGVAHTTASFAPDQAGHLGDGDGSSSKGLLVHSISILDVQTKEARGFRPPLSGVKGSDVSPRSQLFHSLQKVRVWLKSSSLQRQTMALFSSIDMITHPF